MHFARFMIVCPLILGINIISLHCCGEFVTPSMLAPPLPRHERHRESPPLESILVLYGSRRIHACILEWVELQSRIKLHGLQGYWSTRACQLHANSGCVYLSDSQTAHPRVPPSPRHHVCSCVLMWRIPTVRGAGMSTASDLCLFLPQLPPRHHALEGVTVYCGVHASV